MGKVNAELVKRVLMCVFGVLICGLSVGLFKISAFGVDPFQAFMAGLDAVVPIEFGTLYVIANVVLLFFSFFADKKRIGLGTIINLFLVGYAVQFSYEFFQRVLGEITLWQRGICLAIGIVIMCFSSALYFTANLGVSTYDAVALIISENWKWGQFRFVRIITDLCCVLTGCVLYLWAGNPISTVAYIAGLGTIITAFFMGPLIAFFRKTVAEPLLGGTKS